MPGSLFVQHFVEVKHLVAEHGPGGEFTGVKGWISHALSHLDEGLGVGKVGLIVSHVVGKARLQNVCFIGPERTAERTAGDVIEGDRVFS